jgi:hypothetical protein
MENSLFVFFSGLVIGVMAGRLKYQAKLRFYRRFIHERLSNLDAAVLTTAWNASRDSGTGESRPEKVEPLADDRLGGNSHMHAALRYKN